MRRVHQVTLIATFLTFSWLAMMVVHELGHIVGAFCMGASVEKVVLHPLAISRTDVSNNQHPLVVIWAGPIFGSLLPLAMLLIAQQANWACWPLAKFFAGFCLVANGGYIGFGSFERIGDAGDLLGHGSPAWTLWLFGVVTTPFGFWMWNGLGPSFGLGIAKGEGRSESPTRLLVGRIAGTYRSRRTLLFTIPLTQKWPSCPTCKT